jgi:hypothetical protein
MFDHFPKADDSGRVAPVKKIIARRFLHAGPATPDKTQIGSQASQGVHQRRPVIVAACFASDEVNCKRVRHSAPTQFAW